MSTGWRPLYITVGISGACVAAFVSLLAFIETHSNNIRREAYGREAVSALAFDAEIAFRQILEEEPNLRGPRCVFTTIRKKCDGGGCTIFQDEWPRSGKPVCSDFFSSEKLKHDPKMTFPSQCEPIIVWDDRGGARGSYLVLAHETIPVQNLKTTELPPKNRELIAVSSARENYGYPYTNLFIEAGGFDGVEITLQNTDKCDGFTLYRYQTKVKDFSKLHPQLQEAGYFVGLK